MLGAFVPVVWGAPLLALNGVEVRRGMRAVLNDHTFEVNAGELVALVGSNGSGKSTLLETAVGLLPLERGTVRHGDVEVLDAEGRRRSSPVSIGLTLQKNGMLGSEIVSEHLELSCSMRGVAIDFTASLTVLHSAIANTTSSPIYLRAKRERWPSWRVCSQPLPATNLRWYCSTSPLLASTMLPWMPCAVGSPNFDSSATAWWSAPMTNACWPSPPRITT